MKEIDFVYRTMFAELSQRSLDAAFDADFPSDGRFVSVPVGGKKYWYFDRRIEGKVRRAYVGPDGDPEIRKRVEAFQGVKHDLKSRRKLVSTLIREAGLPSPERFTGDIVEALSSAGMFRVRGVLIGTAAFPCFAGILGVRLPSSAMQTADVDFAQFHSISAAVQDTIPPVLGLLKQVDPTYREIPHQRGGLSAAAFENNARFKVEFLTPNRGSADNEGHPATMPALGGASAQPLRFLDFLIYEPIRSVMLHKSGIVVNVPAPERYAIHKLILASRRRPDNEGLLKRSKDTKQAGLLVEALALVRRQSDLAIAFSEAWKRGPSWRAAMGVGVSYLPSKSSALLMDVVAQGLRDIGEGPLGHGFDRLISNTR